MSNVQNTHEYYLAMLNKIAKISPVVAQSKNFENFVVSAYEEDGTPSEDIGYVMMLNCFLTQVEDIASEAEFSEMMKIYDLNKIYTSTLIECTALQVINGILIDMREDI